MKLGFIGLGIMGSRMAKNLIKGGHELVICNRTRSKADELIALGAQWCESAREVAAKVEVLATMLSEPSVVESCALGPEGFLEKLPKNTLWVDFSTVNPSFSRRMAQEAIGRGQRFMDAPVGGSKAPAEAGQLLVMAGGAKADFDQMQPVFDCVGKVAFHVGGHGQGSAMKMVVNLMLGQSMLAFCEAYSLGKALGISEDMLLQTLPSTPVVAPMIQLKAEKLKNQEFSVEFPLQWMQKDLHLANQTAWEVGVPMPSGSLAKEIYALAKQAGWGELDFSAVLKVFGKQD